MFFLQLPAALQDFIVAIMCVFVHLIAVMEFKNVLMGVMKLDAVSYFIDGYNLYDNCAVKNKISSLPF